MHVIDLEPMGKPRMTRSDKFNNRPVVVRYRAYADQLRLNGLIDFPECDGHLIAVIPMPSSWSKKKKRAHLGQPHQQKPDKDNIEKGVLDAVFSKRNQHNKSDDSHVWHGMVSKFWGVKGVLILGELETEIPARAEGVAKFMQGFLNETQADLLA